METLTIIQRDKMLILEYLEEHKSINQQEMGWLGVSEMNRQHSIKELIEEGLIKTWPNLKDMRRTYYVKT